MPTATAKRPASTRERMVRHQIVLYNALERRPSGELVEIGKSAGRGEVIVLSPAEESRLDALGALAAEGQTIEGIDLEAQQTYEAYAQGRRNATPAGGEAF